MFEKIYLKKYSILISYSYILLLLSACGASLQHVPSQSLNGINVKKAVSIMVADIGDARIDEPPDRIGQGASYWLPISYYARDFEGNILPVSFYIAQSLSEDLGVLGYKTKVANDITTRTILTPEESIAIAKKEGMDYLVTTKVIDGKTNYWGFLFIPFFEPVWTRIRFETQIIDIKSKKDAISFETYFKETEWYFGKITIFDSIVDAGIFGGHWHRTAWGETVVSDALAETTKKISEKIQLERASLK